MPLEVIGKVLYKDAAITEEGNGSGTSGGSIAAPIHLAKISFGAARARGVRIAASRPYGRGGGILAANREQLFAAIVEEESDAALATLRELARKLAIYVHIGSLAIKISPDRAANRSFLIGPKGNILARYDKIHMFDVDLKGGESYRESRN